MLIDLFATEGITRAEISVAAVGDAEMHRLNRQFLQHDYPTDVLSFVWESNENFRSGEIIVSSETAIRRAPEFGWLPTQEMALYLIHGALHLVGYDDKSPMDQAEMRDRESHFLRLLGIVSEGADSPESREWKASNSQGASLA